MRAGELRHRAIIQKPDDVASGFNGTRSWHTYATVWCKIEPTRGQYSFDEDTKKDQSSVTHIITIRYIRGLDTSMRLSFEGRFFTFEVIRNLDERNREIQIEAKEETD